MTAKRVYPTSPITMAETILTRLDGVPWPLIAFLERTRNESLRVHTYKPLDPEVDRILAKRDPSFRCVGTYSGKVAKTDLIADVLDALGKLR